MVQLMPGLRTFFGSQTATDMTGRVSIDGLGALVID